MLNDMAGLIDRRRSALEVGTPNPGLMATGPTPSPALFRDGIWPSDGAVSPNA